MKLSPFKTTFKPIYLPLLALIGGLLIIKSKNSERYSNYKLKIFILGVTAISFSEISKEEYFRPRAEILDKTDQNWIDIDQLDFSKTFKKSSAKRTKLSGLKRNIDQVNKAKK